MLAVQPYLRLQLSLFVGHIRESLNEKCEETSKEDHKETLEEELFVLKEAARFVEQELAPINSECDSQGCQLNEGQVSLPPRLKTAFQKYAQAGWMGLCMPEEWGGSDVGYVSFALALEEVAAGDGA